MAFTIKTIIPDTPKTQKDTPDSNLRRVFRFWHRGEYQLRPIDSIVVQLRLSLLHGNELVARKQTDVLDEILARYIRKRALHEHHAQNEMRDMIVVLRLSLMRTLWEKRGYLDLPYIDSVIRDTIRNFQNKHQTQIKQEYWAILADMCWQNIDKHARVELEDTDPVDIDVDDDDIDAWINSDFEV